MIKNKNRKIVALFLLPFVLVGLLYVINKKRVNEIYAVDPIVVTYDGNTTPDAIFEVYNMLPGDEVEKIFNVKNSSTSSLSVVLDGIKTSELKNFSEILDVLISDDSATTYFSGKLKDFFSSPPINLGTFSPGQDKNFHVKVKFPTSAGNEYQEGAVVFDLIFKTEGPPIELPEECKHLSGKIVNVIEGTDNYDNIRGTSRGDLILAKGGKDKVDGTSGDDCIIGGEGNDKRLDGGSGRDTIVGGNGDDFLDGGAEDDLMYGGEGNDKMEGGSGNDKIYGGNGNDKINGSSQEDLIYGEAGNDYLYGGSGDDEVYGGIGEDTIVGDSGDDKLYGEENNDKLYGDSGDDYLDGGPDFDYLRGNTGTDTCVLGETLVSCEL
ncbi:MAG: Hemolysin-type calcium-binding repeat family protein [Candidatus Woesebacteria bacterium GW2011_GWA1_37_8]|uniref:Hemolysin-type calcium-binding repeat family protein n=2 Tax=Candidatus Woeseibacteriota TaxID=1752722 RepID=A0A0G0NP48_9BACT|nr:MAG: Hemolysin-type calcium-binding repeat family protein [Microgenomates group bacterium GW2011_GWC1_37_12b]KKQ45441.1 MAG: Hemolysin-type calcium-binding repeat family protein [Candidatus Woesebacteria bacterium GW2011_GWA1_37_8]KKQ87644.1 MAG: Hemolysin-type calcium-binding repeat family protein [Candidatus Woesebacteria bacterium GW2011_GWB1_38_8b]